MSYIPAPPTVEEIRARRLERLGKRFQALLQSRDPKFTDEQAALEFEGVRRHYDEPERAYHTLSHIDHCLDMLDKYVPPSAPQRWMIELAIWYHDVIYRPQAASGENEDASARYMMQQFTLSLIEIPYKDIDQIRMMILATKTHEPANDKPTAYLLDIDLSSLGAEPSIFDLDSRGIRFEYKYVPEMMYRQGRAAVLRRFLARPRIYQTAEFYKEFEEKARANLERSIRELEP